MSVHEILFVFFFTYSGKTYLNWGYFMKKWMLTSLNKNLHTPLGIYSVSKIWLTAHSICFVMNDFEWMNFAGFWSLWQSWCICAPFEIFPCLFYLFSFTRGLFPDAPFHVFPFSLLHVLSNNFFLDLLGMLHASWCKKGHAACSMITNNSYCSCSIWYLIFLLQYEEKSWKDQWQALISKYISVLHLMGAGQMDNFLEPAYHAYSGHLNSMAYLPDYYNFTRVDCLFGRGLKW